MLWLKYGANKICFGRRVNGNHENDGDNAKNRLLRTEIAANAAFDRPNVSSPQLSVSFICKKKFELKCRHIVAFHNVLV